MYPVLNRALDRLVIRMACRGMSKPGRHAPQADEASSLLDNLDFFCDFVQGPESFTLTENNVFKFRSPISTPWAENNLVRGRLFPCARDWQKFPTVILLHGWNDEWGYQFRFPYLAKLLAHVKINTVVLELPYHFQRRPRDPGAITNFISEDLFRMVEATRQSIADTRALVKWLVAQGCPKIGLWGSSLGAWLSGLVVCHETKVDFAILTTPVAKLEQVIMDLAFCAPVRRSYEKSPFSLSKLNLISHRPKTPPACILIQEAIDDLFAPREAIEDFWLAWNKPDIWRLRHGHISVLMSVPIMRKTVKWISKLQLRT